MLAPVLIALIAAALQQPSSAIFEVAPYRTDIAPSNTRDGKHLLLSATDQGKTILNTVLNMYHYPSYIHAPCKKLTVIRWKTFVVFATDQALF